MTGPVYSALKDRRMELGPFVNTTQLLHRSAIHKRWNHWHLARDAGDVAWLLLDKAGASANVLSEEVLRELGEVIESLQDEMPRALVIRSAKPSSFCVGADISEFRQLHNERDVINKLSDAHILIQQLADLPCPTIAVIHGAALGGGLELAELAGQVDVRAHAGYSRTRKSSGKSVRSEVTRPAITSCFM